MEWISVDNRLPTEQGVYLVWEKYYSGTTGKATMGNWYGGKFSTCISEDWSCVSHWMPLPGPPNNPNTKERRK